MRTKRVPLSEVKDHFSEYLGRAQRQRIFVTRHGRVAGVLIGFKSDEDWFDYQMENDPRFLARISRARKGLKAGRGVRFEDVSS